MSAPQPRPDTDLQKPAAWRWMLFVTLCLFVVSFWIPVEAPATGEAPTPFSATNVLLLVLIVTAAVAVVPATTRIRVILGLLMLGSTVVAWLLADSIRELLGPPWSR